MREHSPKVTIGIPVYNEEKFIEETVLSAVNQSYKDIKIVISDNASTDATARIVEDLAKKHPNILLIKQKENIGAMRNFVFVMDQADTEYFTWLGGHDIMHRDYIQKAMDAYQNHPDISLAYPESQEMDERGNLQAVFPNSSIDTSELPLSCGALKVLKNLGACTAIHGLFFTQGLRKYKMKEIVGADSMILYHAAIQGKLISLKEILYFRREVRKENSAQILQRHNQYGLKNTSRTYPYKEMIQEHWHYTLHAKIRFFQKIILLAIGIPLLIVRVSYYNWVKKK